MSGPVNVAVALLRRGETVLICQRPPGKSYPLKWEFPGGKVEPGETFEEALVRELREELAIEATVGGLFHEETTRYSDNNTYAVRYYDVLEWRGELLNNDFHALDWAPTSKLPEYDILEGNRRICALLATGNEAKGSAVEETTEEDRGS